MLSRSRFLLIVVIAGGFLATACKKTTDSKDIFKDDFNRTGSSLGSNYSVYLPSGTAFALSSYQAWPSTTNTSLPAASYVQKISGSFKMSASFSINGSDFSGNAYLLARATSADTPTSGYACGYYYVSGTTTPEEHKFFLGKFTSGTLSIFGEAAMHTLVSGRVDTITFTADGTTLTCSMTGGSTISISVVDSTYGDGYSGLMGGGQNTNYVYFDNLNIERL